MSDYVDLNSEVQMKAEIGRGDMARDILENPLITEFFEKNEQDIWQAIKNSPVRNVADRESLLLMLKCMEKFKSYLTETVTTGRLASLTLESRRSALQRAKDAIGMVW